MFPEPLQFSRRTVYPAALLRADGGVPRASRALTREQKEDAHTPTDERQSCPARPGRAAAANNRLCGMMQQPPPPLQPQQQPPPQRSPGALEATARHVEECPLRARTHGEGRV